MTDRRLAAVRDHHFHHHHHHEEVGMDARGFSRRRHLDLKRTSSAVCRSS
jgi:hypothetical protein